jgi:hypothetical protein
MGMLVNAMYFDQNVTAEGEIRMLADAHTNFVRAISFTLVLQVFIQQFFNLHMSDIVFLLRKLK